MTFVILLVLVAINSIALSKSSIGVMPTMFIRPPAFALSVAAALTIGMVLGGSSVVHAQWSPTARSSTLTSVMGRGMTAYFDGQAGEAEQLLTQVINAGSQDPRAYYFRALARQCEGRSYEAQQDMQIGAALEARNPAMGRSISQSLTRVQGETRRVLEQFRREGRVVQAGYTRGEIQARDAYQTERDGHVLRRPAEIRVDQLSKPSGVEIVIPQATPQVQVQPSQPRVAAPPVTPPVAVPAPTPIAPPAVATPPTVAPAIVEEPIVAPKPEPVQPEPTQPEPAEDPFGGFEDPLTSEPAETPMPEEAPAVEAVPVEPATDDTVAPPAELDDSPFGAGDPFSTEPVAEPSIVTPADDPMAADEPDATQPADDGAMSLPEESKVEPGKVVGALRRVVGGAVPKPALPKMPSLPDFGPPAAADAPIPMPSDDPFGVPPAQVEPAPAESGAPEEDPFGDFSDPATAPAVEPGAAEQTPAVGPETPAEATMEGAAEHKEEIFQEELAEENPAESPEIESVEGETDEEETGEELGDPFAEDPFSEF